MEICASYYASIFEEKILFVLMKKILRDTLSGKCDGKKTTEKSLETTLERLNPHAKALWRKFQLTGLYLLVMTSNLLTRLMKTCNA